MDRHDKDNSEKYQKKTVHQLFDAVEMTHGRSRANEIRTAVDSSPYLTELIHSARRHGVLNEMSLGVTVNSDGHYDHADRSIRVNEAIFNRYFGKEEPTHDRLVFVIAHEVGHALYAADGKDAATNLHATVHNGIRDARQFGDWCLDLTEAVQQYRVDRRQTEAFAEVMALNSLSSRVRMEMGSSFEASEFLKRAIDNTDCVLKDPKSQKISLADGLSLNSVGEISGSRFTSGPVNAAAANCHFDGRASLGPQGVSDYNHYFGVYPIQIIADAVQENRGMSMAVPQIRLDMAKLGLTPQGLSDAGLDLGGVGKGLDIVDISHGGEKHITLRQTLPSRSTQEPDSPQATPALAPLLSDPAHPAHDLYAQTLRAFAASSQIAAAGYSNEQQQLAAANLVAGTLNMPRSRNLDGPMQEKLDRVDAAAIATDGSYITLIQRVAQNSTAFRFGLPMEQAHGGSIETASQQAFDGLQQQKAQDLARQAERERAPQPEPETPVR